MSNWKSNYDLDLLKYRMAYDNVRELIIFYDAYGNILDINTVALEKLNYIKNNVLDKNISNIYKDIHTATIGEINEMLAYRKDGSCFYVELLINKMEYNKCCIWIAIATDITKQKDFIRQSVAIKNELSEANKAKEEFIVNITHELRTPINGILGWSRLTLDTELSTEQKRNINIIVNSAIDLMSIVNEILEFSKIVSNEILIKERPFNIIEVVKTIISYNNFLLTKNNTTINFNISEDIPKIIIGDQLRVFQILNNIMSSAMRFTYDGTVTLSIKVIEFENKQLSLLFEIIHKGLQFNEQINLFGEEDLLIYEKIWGTELGIDICKNLIETMGGNVEITRKDKIENIFKFILKFRLLDIDIRRMKKQNKIVKARVQEPNENSEDSKVNKSNDAKNNNENGIIKLLEKLYEYILLKDEEKAELIAKSIKNKLCDNDLINKKIFKIQLELRKEDFLKAALEFEELNRLIKKEMKCLK